jgi:hypothetical protein
MNIVYYDITDQKQYGYSMVSATNTDRVTLPEFQKFLRGRKLVAVSKASYYAYWVGRFLTFTNKRKVPADEYRESVVARRFVTSEGAICFASRPWLLAFPLCTSAIAPVLKGSVRYMWYRSQGSSRWRSSSYMAL